VNLFDLLLVVAALFAALGGWRMGFLRRLSGWIGAGLGLTAGILVLPTVMERLDASSDLTIFAVGAAVLVLLASIGQGIGALVGSRLRLGVDSSVGQRTDAVLGAVLGIVGVAVLAWLVLPVMADTEGWPSAAARGSTLSRALSDHLPTPPSQITDLERQLAGGEFPRVFAGLRAAPELPPPPAGSTIDEELLARVSASTVKVRAPACERIQSGSGFFVADGLVATNAHVVAGADGITLATTDGDEHDGRVVAFDPDIDLALIATDLDRPVLPLAEPAVGDAGLVMGFPGGGPFAPSPFQVGDRLPATGFDIYERALVERDLLVLSSALEPGDSGSAVVRDDGTVVGVAMAIAPDREGVAYALASDELAELVATTGATAAATGPCIR
jgi:S1-C subfamily serine protease